MKNFSKRLVTWLIVICATTTSFAYNPPAAHAFNLADLANIFGVGGNDVEKSKQRMLKNFNYSTALLSAAYENVRIATDDSIAHKEIITQEQATLAAMRTSDGGLNMRNGAAQNKRDAEHIRKYLADALQSGDEEKLKQIDAFIETANQQRTLSDIMASVAYTQIGLITISKISNTLSGRHNEINEIITIANETDNLLRVRGELSAQLKMATAEYRLHRGIKDPSKEEQQRTAEQIEKG